MEQVLNDAIIQMNAAVGYLEKKDLSSMTQESVNIVWKLKRSIQSCEKFIEKESLNNNQQSIVSPNKISEEENVYQDNVEEAVYEDNIVETEVPVKSLDSTPCEDLINIQISSLLEIKKETFISSSWQRRWCVVSRGYFFMYDSAKDKKPKDYFALNDIIFEKNEDTNKETKRKGRCFTIKVTSTGKNYQFCASDQGLLISWQKNLQKDTNTSRSITSEKAPSLQDSFDNELYDDLYDEAGKSEDVYVDTEQNDVYDDVEAQQALTKVPEPVSNNLKQQTEQTRVESVDYANFYQGLWDCDADEDNELTFKRGELIEITSKEHDCFGWWMGRIKDLTGYVPKIFLMEAYEF